jgi:hypothetical protein
LWPRQPAQLGDRELRSVSGNKGIWVILTEVVAGCAATKRSGKSKTAISAPLLRNKLSYRPDRGNGGYRRRKISNAYHTPRFRRDSVSSISDPSNLPDCASVFKVKEMSIQIDLPDSLDLTEFELKMHLAARLFDKGVITSGQGAEI